MSEAANPFDNGIVSDAWSRPVADVGAIHGEVSELCLASLAEVSRGRKRCSVLIHGSAGSGKTHLLARFRATVAAAAGETPPFFSYVRLATSPNMMRRHVRSCLVRDLVRKDAAGSTPLESVVFDSLVKESGGQRGPAARQSRLAELGRDPATWDEFRETFGEVCIRLGIDYNLARTCRLFLLRQHRHEAVQWLRCGELPDAVREELGFDAIPETNGFENPEVAADNIVQQLLRLISDTRPIVLCFDQIEALQVAPNDRSGFFAFGKLAAELFDQAECILMITCAQSSLLPQIRQAIPQPDYHRIAQHERVLGSLSEQQAQSLIAARLDASPALRDDPRRRQDPLWPLGEKGLRQFLQEGDRTPRRLFAACRECLPRASDGAIDVDGLLTDLFERRRSEALGTTDHTGAGFIHGLAVVAAARKRLPVATPTNEPDVDLVLSLDQRRIVVSVCNHEGNALTSELRRILRQPLVPGRERILVRDMRLPIPRTAARAWDYWTQLTKGCEKTQSGLPRIRALSPTPDLLASLEAVRSIMSDARSGELEFHGRTIQPRTVEEWIRSRLAESSLDTLLEEIEHGPGHKAGAFESMRVQLRDAAIEQMQRRHVMRVDELAKSTGSTVAELGKLLLAMEPVFGLLGDPPALVFERQFQSPGEPFHAG